MSDNTPKMSPEQKKLYRMLMGELGVANNVQGQIESAKQNLTQSANETNASMTASAARRGVPLNQGQQMLQQADVAGSYGQSLAQAIPKIQQNAEDRKMSIYQMLAGIAPSGDNSDLSGELGDLAGNAMYYYLMTGKKKPDYNTGSYSNLQSPRL